MQQEQEGQISYQDCTFLCITEDVNNCEMDITTFNSNTTTLDEAMEWIAENRSRGHYSCNNFDKIIIINSSGEIEQIHTKKPEDFGIWKCWY